MCGYCTYVKIAVNFLSWVKVIQLKLSNPFSVKFLSSRSFLFPLILRFCIVFLRSSQLILQYQEDVSCQCSSKLFARSGRSSRKINKSENRTCVLGDRKCLTNVSLRKRINKDVGYLIPLLSRLKYCSIWVDIHKWIYIVAEYALSVKDML